MFHQLNLNGLLHLQDQFKETFDTLPAMISLAFNFNYL